MEISAIEFSGLEVAGSSWSLKVSRDSLVEGDEWPAKVRDFSDDSSPKLGQIYLIKMNFSLLKTHSLMYKLTLN